MFAVCRLKAGTSISSLLRGRTFSRFSGESGFWTTATTAAQYVRGKRAYLKFPDLPRKSRELGVSPATFSYSVQASRLVGWYMGMVKSRPILTKSITCSCIYTASDLSSQAIMASSLESYDPERTMRMAGYGMVVLGPTLHFWFSLMSKLFPKQDLASTLKKMVLGQVIYGPVMTAIFFSVNATLQGENSVEVVGRLKRDLFPALVNGVMYWPLCDFITFRFIPVHLQPLMSNGFSYMWTIYLSYMAGQAKIWTVDDDTCHYPDGGVSRGPMLMVPDVTPSANNNVTTQFILLDKARIVKEPGLGATTCLALVADETAAVHFQFWGDECDSFRPGDILRLTNGIFSYSGNRNTLLLRAGKRGSIEKVGEFTMNYVETPNISEIRWVPDGASGRYVLESVVSQYSRIFPPLR